MRAPRQLPEGTVELMDELLAGELPARSREWALCIRLIALGRLRTDVAEVLGRHPNTVTEILSRYLAQGELSLQPGWTGRRPNARLDEDAEAELVESLRADAERGELVTARSVRDRFESATGRAAHKTTVYRFLDRHGWRKVVPRPTHPDADPARREAFKETSQD